MPAPDIIIRSDEKSRLRLREQLDLLALPPAKRRRLMNGLAKQVRLDARGNIRTQRTIEGRAMEPRKDKRKRRKLLMGLGKGLTTRHKGNLHAEVTWKNAMTAKIAYQHQHGIAETWTAGRARRVYGVPNYKAPATHDQARSLIKEGFRLRVAKKRGKGAALKRVPQKWIRENMKLGRAGMILRLMRTGKEQGPQRWKVKPAGRPFLGIPSAESAKKINEEIQRLLGEIERMGMKASVEDGFVRLK
jgi:hypothetical protein